MRVRRRIAQRIGGGVERRRAHAGGSGRGHRPAPRTTRESHHRSHAGREPERLWVGRDRCRRATSSASSRSRKPHEITCDTINAGIYVLEPDTFDRIPKDTPWSIERSFFPSLIERGETFVAYVDRGYWIDIGTPEKHKQVHRDVMDGRYKLEPFASQPAAAWISPGARRGRRHDRRAVFPRRWASSSRPAHGSVHTRVVGRHCHIEEHAVVEQSILWANTRIGQEAVVPAFDPRPPLPHRAERHARQWAGARRQVERDGLQPTLGT